MLCSGRPSLEQGLTSHRTQAPLGRLEPCGHYRMDACHHTAEARMTRPSGGEKALDGTCHGLTHDRHFHELSPNADPDGAHDLFASTVI